MLGQPLASFFSAIRNTNDKNTFGRIHTLESVNRISLIVPTVFFDSADCISLTLQCPLLLAGEWDGRGSGRRGPAEEEEAQTSAAQFCLAAPPCSM